MKFNRLEKINFDEIMNFIYTVNIFIAIFFVGLAGASAYYANGPLFVLSVVGILFFSVFSHAREIWFAFLLLIIPVCGAGIGLYEKREKEVTVIDQRPVTNVKFLNDIKAVSYIASPSGQESSEIIYSDEEFFKNKSAFLEGKSCYLVKKNYFLDSPFKEPSLDQNKTSFECY